MDEAPRLPPFNLKGSAAEVSQRWKSWLRAFQYYADGKGITGAHKLKSLMLHYLGQEVQELFEDLEDPARDDPPSGDNEIKQAVRILSNHFLAATNPVYERHVFRQLEMRGEETADQFVSRLRQQARLCEFGSTTSANEQVRDQFVSGVHDPDLKKNCC